MKRERARRRVKKACRAVLVTSVVVLFWTRPAAAQGGPTPSSTAPSTGAGTPVVSSVTIAAPVAAPTIPASTALPLGGSVVVGSGLSLAAGIQLFVSGPDTHAGASIAPTETVLPEARWRGGVLIDEPMRDAMRLSDHDARERAASVSDVLLMGTVANAFLIDAMAVPLAQGDPALALDAGVAYSLSLGMTLVLGEIIKAGVARARPYERYCIDDANGFGCQNEDRFASFYSLHSAVAFNSAGFSCAMHLSRSLYQDGLADGASCATSLAMATTVAALRIAADRHYVTDVLLGSAMGLVVGYVVPLFLVPHRRPPGAAPAESGVSALVMPLFSPGLDGSMSTSTVGLSVAGTF